MDKISVTTLKQVHDCHATVVHMLQTRITFYAEEFESVQNLIKFYSAQVQELKKQIEILEPKKED